VLIGALEAMRDPALSIARAVFIGLWAFAVVVSVLRRVCAAAVALHSGTQGLEPPVRVSEMDRDRDSAPLDRGWESSSTGCEHEAALPKRGSGHR
jgi:hypothetical protein